MSGGRRPMGKLAMATVLLVVSVAGCSNLSPTEQRAITGTGIGAAGGAVIGAIAGNAGLGAGIGAAAGLAGGLLYDQAKKSQTSAYQSGYRAGTQRQAPNPPQ